MILLLALACAPPPEGLSSAELDDALAVAGEVDAARMEATVRAMVDAHIADPGRIWPTIPGLVHKHANGSDEVEAQLVAVGAVPFIEAYEVDGETARSVYFEFPGTERPDEIVILSCHLDVFFRGADDNSSGVATVVEAARILASHPTRRTVRLAAFSFEETTLLGSDRHYAEHADEDIVAVVNMDPIGYSSDEPGSQSSPPGLVLPDVGDFIAILANKPAEDELLVALQIAAGLEEPLPAQGVVGTLHNAAPGISDFHRSDISAPWMAGITGLYFTDTANFRNPHYHTTSDLPDTIDYGFLSRSGGTAVATAYALAQRAP